MPERTDHCERQERVASGRYRVMVVEDHPEVSDGLRRTLEPEFIVVGAAKDGQEAVDTVGELKPDILLMDITMPRLNGFEAARIIRRQGGPRPIIIFVTVHEEADMARKAIVEAGAAGYVLKRRAPLDLRRAIEEALAGHTFVSPPIADQRSR